MKLYGVTTPSRIKALPQAPTLDEQGMKGFQVVVWHGIYAPKGTPAPVIEKIHAAVRSALKDPVVQQRMAELGAEIVPDAKLTAEGLRTWLQTETDRYGPMIRSAGAYAGLTRCATDKAAPVGRRRLPSAAGAASRR